jgi:membrane protein involved in colicin uptake
VRPPEKSRDGLAVTIAIIVAAILCGVIIWVSLRTGFFPS